MSNQVSRQLYYLGLYFTQGFQMLWRNRFYTAIIALVMSLLLLVVYIFASMSAQTTQAADRVSDRLIITALIEQDKEYKSVIPATELQRQVQALEGVKEVKIITEKETQQRFMRNLGDLKTPPATYIFNEALEVSVINIDNIDKIQKQIANLQGIKRADYLEELVKKLTAVSDYLKQAALAGAIMLSIIALLVVMAVVRGIIHTEQRSVNTMAQVGGSLWTISAPLLIYMLTIVLFSSITACLIGYYVDPQLASTIGNGVKNLPDWLQTSRAFSLFELLPYLFFGSALAVSLIVFWGTLRYTKDD